ncbi:hypothetical protein EG328_009000 [Venturia inaequalis]|uniref:Uncharacterized protein n=1 Tax=Venturia inaequalis TaxID=5025 RepID=A0A8H3YQB8_VENIN|nr:hypothetical protein EG328_009000 [Venturia inaequalis]
MERVKSSLAAKGVSPSAITIDQSRTEENLATDHGPWSTKSLFSWYPKGSNKTQISPESAAGVHLLQSLWRDPLVLLPQLSRHPSDKIPLILANESNRESLPSRVALNAPPPYRSWGTTGADPDSEASTRISEIGTFWRLGATPIHHHSHKEKAENLHQAGSTSVVRPRAFAMALSENTTFEPSAAELINLRKILDRCKVPDVGQFALLPELAVDQHYCFALERFGTTSRIFDNSYYEEEVLSVVMNEEKLDEVLQNDAQAKGVPESHFPPKRRRARPMRSKAPLLSPLNLPRLYESTNPSPLHTPSISFSEAQGSIVEGGIMSPSSSVRPSLSLSVSENRGVHFRIPTATDSVVSFMSEYSHSSWHPQRQQKRRRDSLMQFFRRSSNGGSLYKDRGLSPNNQLSPPSIAEVPELSSDKSHESQDLSSLQSISASTRTSTSSFIDALNPTLSMSDQHAISIFKNTQRFRSLQWRCDCEALRFSDFAQHQRVALALIVGRNRVYLEDRKRAKLAGFKKKQQEALELLENRHVGKELEELERHRLATEDTSARNATALKFVRKRINLLGENATPEHYMRLEEETSAMDRLASRHEREMQGLIRTQEREKLDLLRQQEKDVEDYQKSLEDDMLFSVQTKLDALGMNMVRLNELIEDRKARLASRWYIRLQIARMEVPETAHIKGPLLLTTLELPPEFISAFSYT